MTRTPECKLWKHNNRLMRGGKRVECTICGRCFPCDQLLCKHFDCQAERANPGSMIRDELGFNEED